MSGDRSLFKTHSEIIHEFISKRCICNHLFQVVQFLVNFFSKFGKACASKQTVYCWKAFFMTIFYTIWSAIVALLVTACRFFPSSLKVDVPILTCIFYTFNWLTLTFEMHFVKFHPEVAFCLLSRGKRKYAPLGMRLLWKYIRNYFLVYQLISHFLLYLQNYKEFEAEILDLQSEKYGLIWYQKYTTSGWALGDENVIGIRAFK